MGTGIVEQGHLVRFAADRLLRAVGNNQGKSLATPLLLGEAQYVLAFGGEADAERRIWTRRDGRQDIRRRLQGDRQCVVRLLDLFGLWRRGRVIGSGGDS